MNKSEELAVLDRAIKKLGENSYLGPWLKSIRHGLESDMRSDIGPTYTLAEYRQQAEQLVDNAQLEADSIKARAIEFKETTVKAAQKRVDEIRYNATYRLRKALEEVA